MIAVDRALYAKLLATSAVTSLLAGTTSIYSQLIPDDDALPAIVFDVIAGEDDNETPTRSRTLRYVVKAISEKSKAEAAAIDAQIDLALHNGSLSVTGWTMYDMARESDVDLLEETQEGERYFHVGGNYRILLSK